MGITQQEGSSSPASQTESLSGGVGFGEDAGSPAGRKRAAVELIRNHDVALRNSARRFSICGDDADDAYQRGIEILLSKAPTTDPRQLLPWARTVIKHEALAIRKARERMLGRPPVAERMEESEDWIHLIPWQGSGPDERAEKRELIDRSREALSTLKAQELKALTQLAEGYSYAEIGSMNGWTRTKVNRCLAEGRARFRSVFRESEAGERCASLEPLISASCDGELDPGDLDEVRNHLAACGQCRATLRAFRAAPKAAAALLPAAPVSQSLWERLQEFAVSTQLRFQGVGKESDALGAVAASGGTRGAGAAALAKLATLCVGTAGGAAACVAVGVLPAPVFDEKPEKPPAIERPAAAVEPVTAVRPAPPQSAEGPAGTGSSGESGQPHSGPSNGESKQEAATAPAPAPTQVEQEFTPEAAGTPVPASAPPPPPPPVPASAPAARVPVGGGGEFGP
jgi:RNA polymerase sigma factor (sigma-70 family)